MKQRNQVLLNSVLVCIVTLTGLAVSQTTARLENARWRVQDDAVLITYDLIDQDAGQYSISIVLRQQSNPRLSFSPTANALQGDIGPNQIPGKSKVIRWQYKDDYALPLVGDDYYFELVATEAGTGGLPWWSYVAGGAGVVAAAVLLSGKSSSSEPPPTNFLPEPPNIRP